MHKVLKETVVVSVTLAIALGCAYGVAKTQSAEADQIREGNIVKLLQDAQPKVAPATPQTYMLRHGARAE
jgi:hypothetical protein